MEFNDLIDERFSVRNFKKDAIEQEKLDKILDAGRIAPTARNFQPQRFYVLKTEEAFEKLGTARAMAYEAPVVIMVCADMNLVIVKFIEVGCRISEEGDFVRVIGPDIIKATDIKTMPHPGFPTDMQSLFMTLLSVSDASSLVTETVFENRFMNVNELKRMGADIKIEGKSALVTGVKELQGTSVKATDLRAGASLILAGLIANGESEISDIHHIDRGYVDIENKIRALGGKIRRVED